MKKQTKTNITIVPTRRADPTYHFFCAICGNEFTSHRRHSQSCSSDCRTGMHKIKGVVLASMSNLNEEERVMYKLLDDKLKSRNAIPAPAPEPTTDEPTEIIKRRYDKKTSHAEVDKDAEDPKIDKPTETNKKPE